MLEVRFQIGIPYQKDIIFKNPGGDFYWDPMMFLWKIKFQEKEVRWWKMDGKKNTGDG